MRKIEGREIEKLLEDISFIKAVISKNRPLLEEVLMPARFRLLFLVVGLSIVIFCSVFHFLIGLYGSYEGIPALFKNIVYLVLLADFVFLLVLRYTRILRFLVKADENRDLRGALDGFFSSRLIHVFIPLVILTVLLSVYSATRGSAYYIVPTISIGLGLLYNFFGSMTEIRQWLISGYWFLGSGILSLVFPMPTPIAISLSLGCGLLLFSVLSYFSRTKHMEE
ncbi:MAG: hypothetical protein JRJ51_18620 [Deltaproteobacteria bacterium]|nr:hypothetical protein [Deltaproteobacteria bacterium]